MISQDASHISFDEDEALRLAREDCKALARLRRALSKPCHYRTVAPPGFRNEFHWTHSGRDFFKRSTAPKVKEPQEYKSSHFANEEDFDEYTTGWRFLDVSEDADWQAQAAADNRKLQSLRRRLRKPCQYSDIAPLKNKFHWSQRGRCHFRRPKSAKSAKSLSEPSWGEYRLSNELRAESLRYIAQQLVVEAMDKEQRWRVREFGDVLLESPCCEAVSDELLLRADAKAAAAVARAWRSTRVYSDIKHVPHPVRPHYTACARSIFTTNQFAKSEPGMVQCLAADDLLDLEAIQDVLQVRADAKAAAAVAHAFSATRKYSDICPVPKPIRTHFSAFGRNFPRVVSFVTKALLDKGYAVAIPSRGRRQSARFTDPPTSQEELLRQLEERELEDLLREDSSRFANGFVAGKLAEQERCARVGALDRAQEIFGFADIESPCFKAVSDELLLRADAKAAAAIARAWRSTRVYSDIKHVPHPVRPHYTACARSILTTNQFAKSEPGMVQCLAADDLLDLEAIQDVLHARAYAKAAAAVAHAFSATRKYSDICPVPKPIRTHFSAFGRNMFTTNQFMRANDDKEAKQQSPSKPSSIKTGSIKFDPAYKKTQPLGSPESITGFPEGFEDEQMPELAI